MRLRAIFVTSRFLGKKPLYYTRKIARNCMKVCNFGQRRFITFFKLVRGHKAAVQVTPLIVENDGVNGFEMWNLAWQVAALLFALPRYASRITTPHPKTKNRCSFYTASAFMNNYFYDSAKELPAVVQVGFGGFLRLGLLSAVHQQDERNHAESRCCKEQPEPNAGALFHVGCLRRRICGIL